MHEPEDAVKLILAGPDVVTSASKLLRHGPGRLGELRDGLRSWLEANEYSSVVQAKGSLSREASPDPGAFARAGYVRALSGWPRTAVGTF